MFSYLLVISKDDMQPGKANMSQEEENDGNKKKELELDTDVHNVSMNDKTNKISKKKSIESSTKENFQPLKSKNRKT